MASDHPVRPPLWVCHTCELIGSETDAERHMEDTGHQIDKLSQEVSDGVRRLWRDDQAYRVAGYLAAARMGGLKRV